MYGWLRRRLPEGVAIAVTAAWYVAVAAAVFVNWTGTHRLFFYLRQ